MQDQDSHTVSKKLFGLSGNSWGQNIKMTPDISERRSEKTFMVQTLPVCTLDRLLRVGNCTSFLEWVWSRLFLPAFIGSNTRHTDILITCPLLHCQPARLQSADFCWSKRYASSLMKPRSHFGCHYTARPGWCMIGPFTWSMSYVCMLRYSDHSLAVNSAWMSNKFTFGCSLTSVL